MVGAIPCCGNMNTTDPRTWDWSPAKERAALKRNALPRKCQDPFWAVAFVLAMCSVIGFAVYGCMQIDWKTDDEANTFNGDNLWKGLLSVGIASAFGIVFAFLWSCILKACAGVMIKVSIFTFLGFKAAMIAVALYFGQPIIAIILGVVLLVHCIYFWCVWSRIKMAEAVLAIAVTVLRRYSAAMWISLVAAIFNFAYVIAWCFANYGVLCLCGYILSDEGGKYKAEGFGPGLVYFFSLICLFWGSLVIGYIVHAICCGIVGTWYFGTSRKRTVTDAFIRAVTTSLGSLSFAGFIVAVVRALETMARQAENKNDREGNVAAMCAFMIMRCILQMIGDILDYLNGLAIVRVAVYGESFCTAAKRTWQMVKYRGMDQLINDDLSGMPVWLGCFICYLVCVPFLFGTYYIFPGVIFVGVEGAGTKWLIAFLFSLCALLMPISILTTIPSFVQALYVLWGDDPAALDETHPQESAMLKRAAGQYCGYQVKYDDVRMTGQGAVYA